MATAAPSRPSSPVLLSFPDYQPASPNRVKIPAAGANRSSSKSFSVSSPKAVSIASRTRRSCMCSPTNHPGSFRCSLHKERKQLQAAPAVSGKPTSPPSPPARRTVSPFTQHAPNGSGCSKGMVHPFTQRVPMGTGHWARRALVPSPAVQQQQHRKRAVGFHAGPSRLSPAVGSQ